VPLEEIEILTSAERAASSLSETIPVGVDQFLCMASLMAVAYSSPLTAWLEVPCSEPVSDPSAASSAAADWAMVLARSRARRRSLEMVVSSSLGASFGAGAALGSSLSLMASGALGLGGCTMRGNQNFSRGVPSATSLVTIMSRGASGRGAVFRWP
jgi:hypothetical protein